MFTRNFTSEEIRSGAQMIVHPITGTPMSDLRFDRIRGIFIQSVPRGGWDWDPDDWDQPVISASASKVCEGDAFPKTWQFDPYTGSALDTTSC